MATLFLTAIRHVEDDVGRRVTPRSPHFADLALQPWRIGQITLMQQDWLQIRGERSTSRPRSTSANNPDVSSQYHRLRIVPYHAELAARVRLLLGHRPGIQERAMFGGLGFLCRGNMAVGVWRDWLLLRLGPKLADEALQLPGFKVFNLTGRVMKGWVMADVDAVADEEALQLWADRAWKFAAKLGPK